MISVNENLALGGIDSSYSRQTTYIVSGCRLVPLSITKPLSPKIVWRSHTSLIIRTGTRFRGRVVRDGTHWEQWGNAEEALASAAFVYPRGLVVGLAGGMVIEEL